MYYTHTKNLCAVLTLVKCYFFTLSPILSCLKFYFLGEDWSELGFW